MFRSVDVLIVEDRALDADALLFTFRSVAPHARVLHLRSGDEALQFLFCTGAFASRSGLPPRLVLLSADAPVISGVCLLEIMRAHPSTRSTPVVLLSAEADPRIYKRNDSFDADLYALKQWDFAQSCALVARAARQWLTEPSMRPVGADERSGTLDYRRPQRRHSLSG